MGVNVGITPSHTHQLTAGIEDTIASCSLSNIILSKHSDAIGDLRVVEEATKKIDGYESAIDKCLCTWSIVTPA